MRTHARWAMLAAAAILFASPGRAQTPGSGAPAQKPETHITASQAKELFDSVDQILHFASNDTKLPIQHPVKRQLTTRAAVESYVLSKFHDDKDAKRMERSEIVLKKFGLLDRNFELRPFLVSLLTEQIAGYYDSKTKTVNLLDWIEPDQQKPVMAHELTHALQDQHVDLEKWGSKTAEGISRDVEEDNQHLATDEDDTARDAVAEGQAMAVFIDYGLQPSGKSLLNSPGLLSNLNDELDDPKSSPVLSRAPLLLRESLLFPYREGLGFEVAVLQDEGTAPAFAGVLDRPPATSFEILNPRAYELKQSVPVLKMPDVHPLLDAAYEPYDIGVMGQLDVRMLAETLGGQTAAAELTPRWNGGLYYAVQNRKATAQERGSTASIALLYLSQWTTTAAAEQFAHVYATTLSKKYTSVVRSDPAKEGASDQVFETNEGPVLIATEGKRVFVSESFDLKTARQLELLLTGAQQGGDIQVATRTGQPAALAPERPRDELSAGMLRAFADFGFMRAGLMKPGR